MNSNVKILIVDDNEDNLYTMSCIFDTFKDTLTNINVDVILSNSGKKAIKIADENLIDLIFLDIQMPDMNGFEVAGYLKSNIATKEIPIIFLTAFRDNEQYIKNSFDLGAVDYIVKPFEKNLFVSKVKNYIELIAQNKIKIEMLSTTHNQLKDSYAHELELEKEKIVVMLTHELKTPLNGIISFSSHISKILRKPYSQNNIDKAIKLSEDINSMGNVLFRNVMTILDIAKLQNGKLTFNYSNVDMKILIFEELKIFHGAYQKKIQHNIQQSSIIADKNMIRNIFSNLISNAIKYSNEQIYVSFFIRNDKFEFCVEDDGKGIAEEQREKIFDLFHQSESVMTRNIEGAGVGLYLVKKLCDFFNYTIDVDQSILLGGAKFIITGNVK
jgi:signal transduction histidine kinase